MKYVRSVVFIVNFEHISYLFLVFLLLTLNKKMFVGKVDMKFTRADSPNLHFSSFAQMLITIAVSSESC